ncbi:ADP-ribose glycohydrolase MACROD2 [Sinocyclocheilus rhinocerous]|uniref:ADP-ribose glycohydrolase MACROD2 n=1 Tax=Sinocyclocheilus rhinocerous TaxID=307959 RepID=UPI0007B9F2CA|nr:PREDICTED: O-acetyl-ADP-ribose deacetylase MACROD2 [Sinocyclocheilus rhinocerous]
MSKKKKEWRAEKERLLSLGLEDRRKDYRGNYVPLDKIPTWANHDDNTATKEEEQKSFSLTDKVSLYKGDITILELDAIVNADSVEVVQAWSSIIPGENDPLFPFTSMAAPQAHNLDAGIFVSWPLSRNFFLSPSPKL